MTPRACDAARGLEAAGAEVLEVPATTEGRVDPYSLLRTLGEGGIVSVLVEGGGTLLGSLFDSGLVDKAVGFVAPAIIGGSSAPSPVGGEGPALMSQITRLARTRVETVGDDIMVVGYPQVDGQSHSPGEQ
jgi:diaminohydroxyphosphoribosylaminopyrimidine deaminase/5-amino-6-(5-phosphoribosylamino)uracil reductase